MTFNVLQCDIDEGEGCNGNKCMIHRCVQRTLGGIKYIHVDATGLSVTRRTDYREKAFLPRKVYKYLLQYDTEKKAGVTCTVKPFSFAVKFEKTTPIWQQATPERRAQKSAYDKKRTRKQYPKRYRYEGVTL
jgi:hypothetical protein